jgi:hypothetical protein
MMTTARIARGGSGKVARNGHKHCVGTIAPCEEPLNYKGGRLSIVRRIRQLVPVHVHIPRHFLLLVGLIPVRVTQPGMYCQIQLEIGESVEFGCLQLDLGCASGT